MPIYRYLSFAYPYRCRWFPLLDGYETKEEIFHNDLNIGEEMKIEYYD